MDGCVMVAGYMGSVESVMVWSRVAVIGCLAR